MAGEGGIRAQHCHAPLFVRRSSAVYAPGGYHHICYVVLFPPVFMQLGEESMDRWGKRIKWY